MQHINAHEAEGQRLSSQYFCKVHGGRGHWTSDGIVSTAAITQISLPGNGDHGKNLIGI